MLRRSFIHSLLGLVGGTVLPANIVKAKPNPSLLLQESPIAGFQYHEGERLWPMIQPGDALQLSREPENPHDKRAVRIDWQGHTLGYVPRRDNATISQMLDRQQSLYASITQKQKAVAPWQRLHIKIWLEV